jgi:RNA polymerase sigma factor (sigma-70 family)
VFANPGRPIKELYQRYAGELTRYLRRLARGRSHDADDIAQTAFLKLAALQASGEVRNPRAFLYTAARNLMSDQMRHRMHVEKAKGCVGDQERNDCDEWSPERIALAREQLQILERAILALPPKRRHVFILCRIRHLSYEQVARETGLTVAAVKQHVIRGLADCRKALADQESRPAVPSTGKGAP